MYIVIELQKTGDNLGHLEFVFTDYNQALNKYYTILAYAAVSNVEKHSATILNEWGDVMKNESFEHK